MVTYVAYDEYGEEIASALTDRELWRLPGVATRAAWVCGRGEEPEEVKTLIVRRLVQQRVDDLVVQPSAVLIAELPELGRDVLKRLLLAEIDREEGPRETVIAAAVARLRVAHEVPDAPRPAQGDRVEPDRGPVPER